MKLIRSFVLITFVQLFVNGTTQSQLRQVGNPMLVSVETILAEHFQTIYSQEINQKSLKQNSIDYTNPYTYLQILQDEKLQKYQILFQTDFLGKICYVGCNQILASCFTEKNFRYKRYKNCMDKANGSLSAITLINETLACVLEHGNTCKQSQRK